MNLIAADTQGSCCLDGSCAFRCNAECRIYSPGREIEHIDRLQPDVDGYPSCNLPSSSQLGTIQCSDQHQYLEIEIYLDNYFLVNTQVISYQCEIDTVIHDALTPL